MDEEENLGGIRDRSQSQNIKQKKCVVGTSNQTGRKMRSPPADIFVYGVHPDTTPDDIVEDLACSNIIIRAQDIVIKSREEAFLKSYKISVKAEDLQKALDPSVWPLRVKVREFIYYSRKPAANQRHAGQGHVGQGHAGQKHAVSQAGGLEGASHHSGQQAGGQRGEQPQFLAPNRYSVLEDNVSGGDQPV